ncbi:MAG: O-antigen ligase family protein, partial [bacterium]|nr:O-antigen ligase family protein [bacterium]
HSSFIILIFSLIMTFSRAAWIGLPIFFIVLSVRRATRSLAIVGTVAAIAIGVALWPLIAPRVTGDGRNELRSIAERRSGIRDALALSAIPPFLGVGLHAMPQTVYQSGRTFNPSFSPYDAQPVHDVPLLIAVEVGWFGIALFLLALMHLFPRGIAWRWEYLALAPPFLLDHSLWSLPVGLALAFIFAMSVSLDSVRSHE